MIQAQANTMMNLGIFSPCLFPQVKEPKREEPFVPRSIGFCESNGLAQARENSVVHENAGTIFPSFMKVNVFSNLPFPIV